MGWIRATFPQPVFWQFFPNLCFGSFSQAKTQLVPPLCPSQPGGNILDRPHQNLLVFERCPKKLGFIGDKNQCWEICGLTRVCYWRLSPSPRAMNANITELMEFPCLVFSIEKSENLRKLKLSEISKMGWEVTPFPRSFLTVGKPRTPSPELSDRGQNPASKLTLFYHSCQVIHSNFHIMKISVSSKFLNNQFTVHLHPRNWPYFVEICENRRVRPNNSFQGWNLQPETYKVKFRGKVGAPRFGEICENFQFAN